MNQITIIYIIGVLLVLIIALMFSWLYSFEKRLKKLFRGKKGNDIEEAVKKVNQTIDSILIEQKEVEKILANHNNRIHKSAQGLYTIRFNPFKNAGGQQSFATAFLNEAGDGVVISSLYARERTSVFAKPVVNFKSEHKLTDEEKEALNKAKSQMV